MLQRAKAKEAELKGSARGLASRPRSPASTLVGGRLPGNLILINLRSGIASPWHTMASESAQCEQTFAPTTLLHQECCAAAAFRHQHGKAMYKR